MDQNNAQTALNILGKLKEFLLENLVEELVRHQDEDPSSFSLQEIEDRFAMRLANLNTLIVALQEQVNHNQNHNRISVTIDEVPRHRLDSRLSEMVEFIGAEDFIDVSITPLPNGRFLLVLFHSEA